MWKRRRSRRQVGIRKTTAVDVSLFNPRWHQNRGDLVRPGMSLAGARFLARWCPAWRRREPDLRLSHGTWEGAPRHGTPAGGGDRERPKRQQPQGTEYRRGACWRTGSEEGGRPLQ